LVIKPGLIFSKGHDIVSIRENRIFKDSEEALIKRGGGTGPMKPGNRATFFLQIFEQERAKVPIPTGML
jgi:hypothetical protein